MESTNPKIDLGAQLRSEKTSERDLAWRALYDNEFDRVYRLVCRFGVDMADVEELTQRAFVVAFQRIHEVDNIRNPGAWLRGIAVRVVAQHRRWKRVRDAKRWLLRDLPATTPRPVMTPERSATVAQELDRARAVLSHMKPRLQDVLVLCDIEECTPKEVSALLNIPVNTVRSRRRIARQKFASLWTRYYGADQ